MASTGGRHPASGGASKRTWSIDFAEYAGGPIEAWLYTNGFQLGAVKN